MLRILIFLVFVWAAEAVEAPAQTWPFAPPQPTVTHEYRVAYAVKRGGVVTDVKVDTLAVRTSRVYASEEEVLGALKRKRKRRLRHASVVLITWQFVRYRYTKE